MRIVPPRKYVASYGGQRASVTAQERAARQAVIDKAQAKYLHLVCGHLSTLEVDLIYSFARPKKGLTWCETCNKWVGIENPPAPADTSDEPMF